MANILVIEDDVIIRENVSTYLKMSGHQCKAYQNGKEALKEMQTKIPDIIICDIMMPVMNGYEFFNELKKNIHTSLIPVIFLTAKADKSEIAKGLKLGAEYLTKPFGMKNLLMLIDRKIQKH